MNKLTPEENKRITAMQIAKDVYPSRPGTVHIKAVGLELAIKNYATQEVAEKDEQLEKAVKLLRIACSKFLSMEMLEAQRNGVLYGEAKRGFGDEISDFLTKIKQGQ